MCAASHASGSPRCQRSRVPCGIPSSGLSALRPPSGPWHWQRRRGAEGFAFAPKALAKTRTVGIADLNEPSIAKSQGSRTRARRPARPPPPRRVLWPAARAARRSRAVGRVDQRGCGVARRQRIHAGRNRGACAEPPAHVQRPDRQGNCVDGRTSETGVRYSLTRPSCGRIIRAVRRGEWGRGAASVRRRRSGGRGAWDRITDIPSTG